MKPSTRIFAITFCALWFFSACAPQVDVTETPVPSAAPTATSTPAPLTLWLGASLPPVLRAEAEGWGIPIAADPALASLHFDAVGPQSSVVNPPIVNRNSDWIYALVAPFPTVTDGVTLDELKQAWAGASAGSLAGRPLWMADSTLAAFSALWGEPAPGSVRTAPAGDLLDAAWNDMPSWAIIPFEEIQPRWKVLMIDDQSPLHKDFDASTYPLQITFALTQAQPFDVAQGEPSNLPTFNLTSTNRDPSKLTTVILTGVTALVRGTAYIMENKGITYPGQHIRDLLRGADITHISNEVPFFDQCPYPNPGYQGFIFCSDTRYIGLFEDVGADVIELTGDHFDNYGYQAMLDTTALYREKGMLYYGGGDNLEDARKPLLIENNGNQIAFIGCNSKPDEFYPKATDSRPGPAPCDRAYMVDQIRSLTAEGYLVIATFQHYENYSASPNVLAPADFHMMAEAGAVVVSGSQAHYPQSMGFYDTDSFIHYGLGNLFFDQMYYNLPDGTVTDNTRLEFLDRHVFYDGRYLGVEIFTNVLEDFASPRPMTLSERA
ncbi:MAG: CapA family protein, partial [Chloroflexota bacterium]